MVDIGHSFQIADNNTRTGKRRPGWALLGYQPIQGCDEKRLRMNILELCLFANISPLITLASFVAVSELRVVRRK